MTKRDFKIFLQVRNSSTRLPYKSVKLIMGKTMLEHQLERLKFVNKISDIIVLTSKNPEDNQIVEIGEKSGVSVYRGELKNVAKRFLDCLDIHPSKFFIRITGDCPLISPEIINQMIDESYKHEFDYFSNNLEPTYPDGLDVEIVKSSSFCNLMQIPLTEFELEHVTYGMYSRPNKFKCINFKNEIDLSELRWTVDLESDFDFIEKIYKKLYKKGKIFDILDILKLLNNGVIESRTSNDYPRNKVVIEYEKKIKFL